MDEQLGAILKNKHILFDTCVVSDACRNITEKSFKDLFLFFKKFNCPVIINKLIEVEFLRDSKHEKMLMEKLNFLGESFDASLGIGSELLKESVNISNIYLNKGSKGQNNVSLSDLVMSAFLKKYNKNIVLMTNNHKDFPLIIHDRIGNVVIDLGGESPKTYGFYVFNIEKYDNALADFRKSGEK